MKKKRAREPDNKRITVKLAASILSLPSAKRQSTELAANATRVTTVDKIVLSKEILYVLISFEINYSLYLANLINEINFNVF